MGSGVGSFFAGPFSETFGRLPVYIVSLFIFMVWVMASALSPNIGAQLAFRFLAGVSGAAPLTCAGASISDLWDPVEKTWAMTIYSIPAFGGPMIVSCKLSELSKLTYPGSCDWCVHVYQRHTVMALDGLDHTDHHRPCNGHHYIVLARNASRYHPIMEGETPPKDHGRGTISGTH